MKCTSLYNRNTIYNMGTVGSFNIVHLKMRKIKIAKIRNLIRANVTDRIHTFCRENYNRRLNYSFSNLFKWK